MAMLLMSQKAVGTYGSQLTGNQLTLEAEWVRVKTIEPNMSLECLSNWELFNETKEAGLD